MKTGSLISAGLAITTPTGPSRFAGAPYLFPLNSVYFQPYIGYIYNYNRWYIQGFSGFNFTSNINDVSYIFNDIAVGYYLFRDEDPRALLSAVAPTFELHVNNPINHRDVFNRFDLAGMPDSVDLTFGLNFQFRRAAVLTFAYVAPGRQSQAVRFRGRRSAQYFLRSLSCGSRFRSRRHRHSELCLEHRPRSLRGRAHVENAMGPDGQPSRPQLAFRPQLVSGPPALDDHRESDSQPSDQPACVPDFAFLTWTTMCLEPGSKRAGTRGRTSFSTIAF